MIKLINLEMIEPLAASVLLWRKSNTRTSALCFPYGDDQTSQP